jgi:hypothetical protein
MADVMEIGCTSAVVRGSFRNASTRRAEQEELEALRMEITTAPGSQSSSPSVYGAIGNTCK